MFLFFSQLPGFLNLLWIQEVALLDLLLWINKPDCCLLLNEPLVSLLEIVLLVAFVVRINDFSQHFFKTLKQFLHVTEIYALGCFDILVFLPDSWLLPPIPFLLNEKLYQSCSKPIEDRIVVQSRTLQGVHTKLKTLHGLDVGGHWIIIAIGIIQVWIKALTITLLTSSFRVILKKQKKVRLVIM